MLGCIAFGGPAAHVALMHREVVARRRWLSEGEFLRLFAACNLIPGPSSTELAIYLGYRRAGWRGLLAAGVAFILPAMLLMLAIAWVYSRLGATAQASGVLYGVRAAVIGIVAWAIADLGRRLLSGWQLAILAAIVAGLSLLGVSPVLLLIAAALLAAGGTRLAMLALAVPSSTLAWPSGRLLTVFLTFLKLGAISFGSGYVLYAFLHADFVLGLHWLTDRELADAVAIGQATPGPVFTTATFLGFLFAGVPGALLATLAIFLPGFLLVPLLDRIVRLVESRAWVKGLVDGANAAALGLIAAVTFQLGRAVLVDTPSILIALAALVVVTRWPLSTPAVVVAAALAGLARQALA
jgi:chromate transporter